MLRCSFLVSSVRFCGFRLLFPNPSQFVYAHGPLLIGQAIRIGVHVVAQLGVQLPNPFARPDPGSLYNFSSSASLTSMI